MSTLQRIGIAASISLMALVGACGLVQPHMTGGDSRPRCHLGVTPRSWFHRARSPRKIPGNPTTRPNFLGTD